MTAAQKSTRRRRWVLGGLILFLIAVAAAYMYFTSAGFLRPRVERALNDRLNARTTVEGIDFGLLAGTSIDRLTLVTDARSGENVLDLFKASGSILIGCEQGGRQACLMEMDELYRDVIVRRWVEFTGRKAERIIEERGGQ